MKCIRLARPDDTIGKHRLDVIRAADAPRQREPGRIMDQRKIAIVNEHPVVLRGLAQVIGREPDLQVCAEIADPSKALPRLAEVKPDLVIVELAGREVGRGTELIQSISARMPALPILALSMYQEAFYAGMAFRAGARGYLSASQPIEQIVAAVRQALSSGVYVNEKMAVDLVSRLLGHSSAGRDGMPPCGFTDREFEIFDLIGQGLSMRQIAEKLHRSVKTVEAHREHIKKKLHLQTAGELVRHAIHWVEYRKMADA